MIRTLRTSGADFRLHLLELDGNYGNGFRYGVELDGFLRFKTDDIRKAHDVFGAILGAYDSFRAATEEILENAEA